MDENAPVGFAVETQTPTQLPSEKKNIKLLLLGALGIAVIAIVILSIYYFSVSGNKKNTYGYEAYNRYKEGNYEKSQSIAKEGLARYPDDPTLLRLALDSSSSLANSKGTEKQTFEQNKDLIATALKVGSKDPDMLLAIGYSYETAGKYEEALQYYEKAIALKETADAYFHKGHVLAFLDKANESKEAYEKAFSLDPNNAEVLLVKAALTEQEKDHINAKSYYLKAAESKTTTNQTRSEALTGLATLEIADGDKDDALSHAQYAVKTDPNYAPAEALYGLLLTYDKTTYNTGTHTIYNAIKKNPRITMDYLFMGLALRKAKLTNEAINYQLEGLKLINNDNTLVGEVQKTSKKAKMYYELGQTYAIARDVDNAIESLEAAFQTLPTYKTVIRNDIQKGYFAPIVNDPKFVAFLDKN